MDKNIKYNSDKAVRHLVEVAAENGYSLLFNSANDGHLHMVAYPFKGTMCSQEELARTLYDEMDEMGITETEIFDHFRKDVEPDDLKEFVFSGETHSDIHINIFHNKNILLKQIVLKI